MSKPILKRNRCKRPSNLFLALTTLIFVVISTIVYTQYDFYNNTFPGVEHYIQYSINRLELQPLPEQKSLIPGLGLVFNNVTNFQYPITIPKCQQVPSVNRSVFVSVISAPENWEKRTIIRQTWPKHLRAAHDEGVLNMAGFAFFIGWTEGNRTRQDMIEDESRQFGDIVQIEMDDFYRNLSVKVTALLNWVWRHCTQVDFVLKVDDDVFVNVHNLARLVHSHNSTSSALYGTKNINQVDRNGKWKISRAEWPWNVYPPYLGGAAVLMHSSAVFPLLAATQTMPMMPFDDIYLTGLCATKAGVKVLHSKSFLGLNFPDSPTPCDLRSFVTWLTSSAVQMSNSYVETGAFYRNATRCVTTDVNGVNRTLDYTEPILFDFN